MKGQFFCNWNEIHDITSCNLMNTTIFKNLIQGGKVLIWSYFCCQAWLDYCDILSFSYYLRKPYNEITEKYLQAKKINTNKKKLQYVLTNSGRAHLLCYLPFFVSCCLMLLIKWTFLKLFGLGEPDRVRHLKNKAIKTQSETFLGTKTGRKDQTNDGRLPTFQRQQKVHGTNYTRQQ